MTDQHPDKEASNLTMPFQLADWHVHPASDRISRNNEETRLEPRVMAVLSLLATRAGEVVSREELEANIWGNTIVGYDALASSINKLRKALGDDTSKPRYIETVSKKGYRLIAPIIVENNSTLSSVATPENSALKNRFIYIVVVLLLGIGFASYLLFSGNKESVTKPDYLSPPVEKRMAVLPFTNISGNPEQDYFVDGITDDLITDLSGLSGIVIVSRSATFSYKGQEVNSRAVGQELGADFLLEGSVRKSGKRWRINVKLINTKDGTNLWAKRYENTESTLFKAQDEVVNNIVRALALQLNVQDKQRLGHRPTTNFEAYDLFLLGQKLFKARNKESNQEAQQAYRRAIKLDPNFARAHGSLAVSLDVHYWRGWSDTPEETLDRALAMSKLAIELDPSSPQAYWALGYTRLYRKELDMAATAVEHAITLAPNYADGYGLLALINNYLGNGETARQLVTKGMKINPHYTWDYPYNLGRAYYTLGEHQKAIEALLEALDRNEHAASPRIYLAAAYMAAGQKDNAIWEVEQIRVISPEFTLSHIKKNYPIINNKKLQDIFFDQLRQAGLPE
ncbi:MAG: hypothetical protein BMS9Abin33_0248 [Gammaproteobacteria bacterium]|nr:MAG: hypothetical protein BMS9Abin33_0248 [Gammaproteobacteria bacterium]